MTYDAFIKTRIFEPLQMTSACHAFNLNQHLAARGHVGSRLSYAPTIHWSRLAGAGDIWMNLEDSAKWQNALSQPGRLLSDSSLRSITGSYDARVAGMTGVVEHGYAMMIERAVEPDGLTTVGHGGNLPGFKLWMSRGFKEDGQRTYGGRNTVVVSVFANTEVAPEHDLMTALMEHAFSMQKKSPADLVSDLS